MSESSTQSRIIHGILKKGIISRRDGDEEEKEECSENVAVDKSNTGTSCSPSYSPKVHFQHVTIREYSQVIGDNPSCSIGAPVR